MRPSRLLPLALVAALSLPALADPAAPGKLEVKLPAQGTRLKFFSLLYAAREGSEGEVLLNGVPLVTFTTEGISGSTNEASSWLFEGENTVEVVATKLAGPDEIFSRAPFTVSLHGLTEPGFPEDENALWTLETKPENGFPGRKRYVFKLPASAAPASQLMEKAEVLTKLTAEDERALTAFTGTILAAVKKGDPAVLRETWGFKMAEQARILGRDPKEMLGSLEHAAKPLARAFEKAELPKKLEFSLAAGQRVVRVTKAGGKSAIEVSGKNGSNEVPVFAARIDGRWTLVR